MSDSLQPHELQHAGLPHPSLSPSLLKLRSIELVMLSHPLLSPSPLTLNLFPASASFPVSQFFTSGGQRIGASASASVLPMNIQG